MLQSNHWLAADEYHLKRQMYESFPFLEKKLHIHLREGLAVASIARDDGSSNTNHSSDRYDYDHLLRVTHFISYTLFLYALYTVVTHVSYANSVTRFIRRPLRSIRGAVLGRCGN